MITIDVTGLDTVQRALQRLGQQVEQAMVQAMRAEAERVLEASQPLVPVDTGALRQSGETRALPDGAEVRYGAGLDYAIVVHERTDVYHPIGSHHYLSQAVNQAVGEMAQRLAQDVAAALRR
jgi:bacteriophage HK97-gp10 putative tail-component